MEDPACLQCMSYLRTPVATTEGIILSAFSYFNMTLLTNVCYENTKKIQDSWTNSENPEAVGTSVPAYQTVNPIPSSVSIPTLNTKHFRSFFLVIESLEGSSQNQNLARVGQNKEEEGIQRPHIASLPKTSHRHNKTSGCYGVRWYI